MSESTARRVLPPEMRSCPLPPWLLLVGCCELSLCCLCELHLPGTLAQLRAPKQYLEGYLSA